MPIRRIIFWMHLVTGCTIGVFIFLMATTGMIMTYERQIVASIELQSVDLPDKAAMHLSVDKLVAPARQLTGQDETTQLDFHRDETAPVSVLSGRRVVGFLHPYTGEVLPNRGMKPRAFFNWIRSLHRWLALEGTGKDFGKNITGAANIGFAFIIISGLYLWLPKVWRWQVIRVKALLLPRHPNTRAREYNWHHVFGIWALLPLFIISLSGMVFSYDWASDLVYRAMGDEPPAARSRTTPEVSTLNIQSTVSLQEVLDRTKTYNPNWKRIRLEIPSGALRSTATLYAGTGGQPTKRTTLTYDLTSGELVKTEAFKDIAPGRRARIFVRYLHTGEVFGIAGQTAVGLSAFAACLLVYTGLSLAFRRLLLPVFHQRKAHGIS